jgi:hypothetical protein
VSIRTLPTLGCCELYSINAPDRRRRRCLNVVCVIVPGCVGRKRGKSGAAGLGKGPKRGAVDSEHGASKGRSLQLHTKSFHSSMRVVRTLKYSQMSHMQ